MAAVNFEQIFDLAVQKKASDIHMSSNRPIFFRIYGTMYQNKEVQTPHDQLSLWVQQNTAPEQKEQLDRRKYTDFSYVNPQGIRFRVNAYQTRRGLAVAMRLVPDHIPKFETLGLPEIIRKKVLSVKQGLILIVGPTGHGKSTSLASLMTERAENKSEHFITLEDPIEFILDHENNTDCLIHQREKGQDFIEFSEGIRAGLREDPDVMLVGEMRDLETISTAITAAETGHVVFSTLHTNSAPETISRIIDAFPGEKQQQIRTQLASSISMIVSQRLIPAAEGGRVPCYEIMTGSYAIKNHIRQNSIFQIHNSMQTDDSGEMVIFDHTLAELYLNGKITGEVAEENAMQPENFVHILENLQRHR